MEKKRLFTVVSFIDENTEDIKSVDIVPTDWVTYKEENGCLYSPFIEVFTEKTKKDLDKLVKNLKPPKEEWKLFKVDVRGHAGKTFFIRMFRNKEKSGIVIPVYQW